MDMGWLFRSRARRGVPDRSLSQQGLLRPDVLRRRARLPAVLRLHGRRPPVRGDGGAENSRPVMLGNGGSHHWTAPARLHSCTGIFASFTILANLASSLRKYASNSSGVLPIPSYDMALSRSATSGR